MLLSQLPSSQLQLVLRLCLRLRYHHRLSEKRLPSTRKDRATVGSGQGLGGDKQSPRAREATNTESQALEG